MGVGAAWYLGLSILTIQFIHNIFQQKLQVSNIFKFREISVTI